MSQVPQDRITIQHPEYGFTHFDGITARQQQVLKHLLEQAKELEELREELEQQRMDRDTLD